MTDNEINIAIAKACGWWGIEQEGMMRPPLSTSEYKMVPDYCHDLNAMAQAECQVKHDCNDTHLKYLDILCSLCGSNREAFHATARQRAESFMRVKGLWK